MKKNFLFILIVLITTNFLKGQVIISLLLGDKLNSGKVEFGLDGGLALTSIPAAPLFGSHAQSFKTNLLFRYI